MRLRRAGIVVCLMFGIFAAAAVGATKPVKIDKTKTSFKEHRFAGTGCETAIVGPGGVIYETECHRPLPLIQLQAFQVVAPRPTSVHFSGVVNAQGCNRFIEIDMKEILLIDGKRIRTVQVHVPRTKKPADFTVTRTAPISKGKHWIELSIQPTEEEGLSGLCVNEATLGALSP